MDEKFKQDFRKLMEDVASIKVTVTSVETKFDSIRTEVSKLKEENTILKTKITNLTQENADLNERMLDLEQYSRVNNLVISGLPMQEGESPRELVKLVAKKLEIKVEDYDICVAHRLPSKMSPPSIIARLNNRELKNNIIKAAKKAKLNGSDLNIYPSYPIFCDEHLTKQKREILNKALELKKSNTVSFVWHRDGNIFIRETPQTRAIKITSLYQLETEEEETETEQEDDRETDTRQHQQQNGNDDKAVIETSGKKRTAEERSPIEGKGNKNRQKKRCPVLQGLASQSTLEKFKFRHRGTVENKNVSVVNNNKK